MRSRTVLAPVFAALMVFAIASASPRSAVAQSQFGDPDATPAPFNPQMSAMMSMLIQPRHEKIGLAGQAENWTLAGYYLKELKAGFGVVSRAIPRWNGLPVPDLFDAAVSQALAVLDFAIKAGEPRQFAESYGKLTTGCNNCHTTVERAYIVIKSPSASGFPNQEFTPPKR